MSDKTHYIGQIQTKEEEAAKLLEMTEAENSRRVQQALEDTEKKLSEAEAQARAGAQEQLKKAKEEAKDAYRHIIVETDNIRRDTIEGGKLNLDKAKKHIQKAFHGLFA